MVGYYLDETQAWGMDMGKIKELVDSTRAEGKFVRALVFINPGNPTGEFPPVCCASLVGPRLSGVL